MRTLSKSMIALSAAACLMFGASTATAAPSPPVEPSPGPSANPVPVPGPPPPKGEGRVIASADWGVGADGQRWFAVNKGHLVEAPAGAKQLPAKPSTNNARAVVAGCHEEITEFELDGITEFQWFTEQICTGAFGVQDLSTQIRRSSWRGLLNYTNWATYPETPSPDPYISTYWTAQCNYEHGFYDYVGIIKAWAEGVGSGPTVRTDNTISQADCGPTAG